MTALAMVCVCNGKSEFVVASPGIPVLTVAML